MRFLSKVTLAIAATALIVGFSVSVQAKEWRGWNIHVAGYPNTVAMDKFAELLKEKSGGKMTVKMYHSGTLGSQPDAIEQLRIGGIEHDLCVVSCRRVPGDRHVVVGSSFLQFAQPDLVDGRRAHRGARRLAARAGRRDLRGGRDRRLGHLGQKS